jgi:predicted transposase YbfD/YdcC
MVSAWSTSNGIVLRQEKVADKSNEITAIPEDLKSLDITGSVVTLDAMGCQ